MVRGMPSRSFCNSVAQVASASLSCKAIETAALLPIVGGCSSFPPLPPVDQKRSNLSRVMGRFSERFRQGVIGRFVVQLMPSLATFFLRLRDASFSLTSAVEGLTT